MELIKQTNIDFVRQSRFFAALSALAVVLSIGLWLVRGFNLGIEFTGGTVMQVRVAEVAGPVDEGRLREATSELDVPDLTIVRVGSEADRTFLVSLSQAAEERRDLPVEIRKQLSERLGGPVELQRVESIGPRVGGELRRAGLLAFVFSWIAILVYVWFRFDLRYAPGGVIALIHDVVVTAGVFVLFRIEFDLNVLAALLVIVGYSINDTIVIYDRIRELMELRGSTNIESVVNQAVNQTLSRTLLTSGLTLLSVLAILIFGGPVLFGFALALTIGVLAGTYSTVYVASALLIFIERRLRPVAS
jgi:preprotein translocase subunit SecF